MGDQQPRREVKPGRFRGEAVLARDQEGDWYLKTGYQGYYEPKDLTAILESLEDRVIRLSIEEKPAPLGQRIPRWLTLPVQVIGTIVGLGFAITLVFLTLSLFLIALVGGC